MVSFPPSSVQPDCRVTTERMHRKFAGGERLMSESGTKRYCACWLMSCPELEELRTRIKGLWNSGCEAALDPGLYGALFVKGRRKGPIHFPVPQFLCSTGS